MQQRLFEITYLLTEHGQMTAGQLAERFDVSRRTIYRDIDALSSAGIPVYAEKGRGGGIRMLPDYVLDRTLFTEGEQKLILSQLQSLALLQTPDSQMAYDKLAALFGKRENWLDIDFAPWAQGDAAREVFRLLRGAIWDNLEVAFAYTGSRGERSERVVYPARILFRGQGWYLHAFCTTRQAYRVFKLSRILDCRLTGNSFAPLEEPPPATDLAVPAAGMVELVLRYDARAAYRVYDDYAPGQIAALDDGRLEVRCEMPDDGWLLSMLLAYGDIVEVVEPVEVRERLVGMLQKIKEKYEK